MTVLLQALAFAAYSLLLRLVEPLYVLRLWLRGRAEPLYRHAIAERLGVYRPEKRGAVDSRGAASPQGRGTDDPSDAAELTDRPRPADPRDAAEPRDAAGATHPRRDAADATGDLTADLTADFTGDPAGDLAGMSDPAAQGGWIWVHAVSLGETLAAAPLIDALRRERPGMRLLLTHGTATGRAAGQALLRPGDRQTWLPYDTPGAVRSFFKHFCPAIGVLMETEIWPNLLRVAFERGVPMVLANARMSQKSFDRGRRVALVLVPATGSLALVLAQSEDDAQRLRAAGAKVVEVAGNLKFDLTPDPALLHRGAAWRAALDREVVLAAVTREGEEAPLLAAWTRQEPTGALLLIVPRHPQRFDEVAGLVEAAGLTLVRRSSWQHMPPPAAFLADVWLGDSMREMALYYAAADVALLGGSFAPVGGQNLIEAAACACPLLIGPSTYNFSDAAELSLAAGASLRVADVDAAVEQALRLLRTPDELDRWAGAAVGFATRHRGAAAGMAREIVRVMG